MTKIQKIRLAIFMAFFVVPEILWSPVGNVLYSFFQSGKVHPQIFRDNFLLNYHYEILLKIIISIQLLGIFFILFNLIKFRKNINNLLFLFFCIMSFILFVIAAFVFYLVVMFNLNIL